MEETGCFQEAADTPVAVKPSGHRRQGRACRSRRLAR
ncbi:hypothetical protein L914_03681 [Phytophthora nicotianae]|uniref:Uncharacterized protein n=1 Tax=Phytophthora nicotianae TaxID=4792 RepID=W2NW85_PHYNI|nr:hypothetical protein L914_03681 [Phytophthora nicotianae]